MAGGRNALLDYMNFSTMGAYGGDGDVKNNLFESGYGSPNEDEQVEARPDELRQGRNAIWPPHHWWDAAGVRPSIQKRYGQAQALATGALDLWGIPSALLSRASPEAAQVVSDIQGEHPGATMVGNAASAYAGLAPARLAGDALAKRGYGIYSQAGADAASVAAPNLAGEYIRHGSMAPNRNTDSMAAAAAATRIFMPNIHPFAGPLIGAGAGAIPGYSQLALNGNPTPALTGALTGAALGSRAPSKGIAPYNSRDMALQRDLSRGAGVALPSALALGKYSGMGPAPPDPSTYSPAALDFLITKDAPDYKYPPRRPHFASEHPGERATYPPPPPFISR